jgi:HK97 family phage portal protein
MAWFRRSKKVEERATNFPNGSVPVSSSNFAEVIFGIQDAATGIAVTTDRALGVPAVWAAVNFLSGTIAGLPLNLYKRTKDDGREKVKGGLATILHDAANDEMSSFDWRKYAFQCVFTEGRSYTLIVRTMAGQINSLIPLEPAKVSVKMENGKRVYTYRDGGVDKVYGAAEILDIPFMLKGDLVNHRSPIYSNRNDIALAIAATEFGSRFFANGGVPPFAITGNFQSGAALNRAGADLSDAVRKAANEKRQALTLPAGLEIKSLGADAAKSQLTELIRFQVEQIARIYSLPPTFLQDLSKGTYSNTEQQDLHFVKHTLKRWIEQAEQEMNLKFFGRISNKYFVEFNVDGLLRGDFKTRMEGYAQGVQNGILKPNEVRRKENMPDDPDGDKLMIQGATVPIGSQPNLAAAPAGETNNGT